MSSRMQEEITCPVCKKTSQYTMWRSINTKLNPEVKPAVRDGSAFMFTCPHCGERTHVEYGFLYHQMEDQIMIWVSTTEESVEEALSILSPDGRLADFQKDFKIETHYLNRIVSSQNQLREKIAIFDGGLDDRIIELYKFFLLLRFQESNPDVHVTDLLYYADDSGEQHFELLAEDHCEGYSKFSREFYDNLCGTFLKRLKDIRDDEPVIDQAWAIRFLKA